MTPYRAAAADIIAQEGPLITWNQFRDRMRARGFRTNNAYFTTLRAEMFPDWKEHRRQAKQDRIIANRSGPL